MQTITYTCLRCGYDWNPRADRIDHRPRVCPACKSHYWDKPRADQQPVQTGGEGEGR